MRLGVLILLTFVVVSMRPPLDLHIAGRAAASHYPAGQFVSPLNRQLVLSGTFGELRTNHFHAGLDLKSKNGTIGDTVYAAGDGYISRIKVDAFGYGNCLFIDHANGYTTVYAHLDRFMPALQQYVEQVQYQRQEFEVDLRPTPFQFPVSQLDDIGIMGNTGHSDGPHLHFEIRHTDNQVPVNPLLFGFSIPDLVPPTIQQLIAYQYNDAGELVQSTILQPKMLSPGSYTLEQPLVITSGKITFGIRACDFQDGFDNPNGIYSLECLADGDPSFAFAMDEIPFEDTRYLNAHIDYAQLMDQNRFFHRCFPLEGNKLPIYYRGIDDGMVYLNSAQPRSISIDIADFNGNVSVLQFEVSRTQNLLPFDLLPVQYQVLGTPQQVSIVTRPGIQVVWPEGSFYERTPLVITPASAILKGEFVPRYSLSPKDAPVHNFFDISIDGSAVPAKFQEKAYIARCDGNRRPINCGGQWVGKNLTTSARQMGMYTIMLDTIRPTITPVKFSPKMTGWKEMTFRMNDNVRIRDKGKDLRYSAWVDGQWILMALDGKTGKLTHEFDGRIQPGNHELVIQVTDDRGNTAMLRKTFTL